eukprot:656519-Pyramimonas_sp.AAC.2
MISCSAGGKGSCDGAGPRASGLLPPNLPPGVGWDFRLSRVRSRSPLMSHVEARARVVLA